MQRDVSPHAGQRSSIPGQDFYSIRDLATEFNISLRTLRFYEQQKLLNPKRLGWDRAYREQDRAQLRQILQWTRFGFTLSEIRSVLPKGGFSRQQLADQLEHLLQRQDDLARTIEELRDHLDDAGSADDD